MMIIYTHFSSWTRDVIQIFLVLITWIRCFIFCSCVVVVAVVVRAHLFIFYLFIGYAYMRWMILVLVVNARCVVKWIAEQKNDWTDASSSLIFVCLFVAALSTLCIFFHTNFSYSSCLFLVWFFFIFFSIKFSSPLILLGSFLFSIKVPTIKTRFML